MDKAAEDATRLLQKWREGDPNALSQIMGLLQGELREIAAIQFSKEPLGHTLQPTALINELYIKLNRKMNIDWQDRDHFFAVAAKLLKQILIDHARKKTRSNKQSSLSDWDSLPEEEPVVDNAEWLDLEKALSEMQKRDDAQHQIVMLRFFAGLTVEETAELMKINERTVRRKWAAGRIWLLAKLKGAL